MAHSFKHGIIALDLVVWDISMIIFAAPLCSVVISCMFFDLEEVYVQVPL